MKITVEEFRKQVDAILQQLQGGAAMVAQDGHLGQAGLMLAAAQTIEVLWWKAFPPPLPPEMAPPGGDQ